MTEKGEIMTDKEIIDLLSDGCQFSHVMEGEYCTEISFHDDDFVLGGTIRRHPMKQRIVDLVRQMPRLKKLDLRKCKLVNVPVMSSCDLEYVDISCNDLESLPEWVLRQHKLKHLNVGANKIQELPDLSHLRIEVLKLHKNSVAKLPNIWNGIKSLNLFINRFDCIPPSVLGMHDLEVFTFGLSSMKDVPPLAGLPKLRWLTLTVSEIERLPDDICDLKSLEGLQLAKNRLKTLPDRIGEMNLKAITVYQNNITRLPESFYTLKLKKLNLARNPLEEKDRALQIFGGIDFIRV